MLFIIKQLAKLQVKHSTINIAYKTFLESILVYCVPIIYGHLSAEHISQCNHIIESANKLSKKQLSDVGKISNIYQQSFKTKCRRMTYTESDSVLVFDKPDCRQ